MIIVLARDPKRNLVLVKKSSGKLSWYYEMEKFRKLNTFEKAPNVTALNVALGMEFKPDKRRAA
jgi:hypothetical protein